MRLDELHRIKQWHVAHHSTQPVETRLWDMVLMLWVAGCIGWLPVFEFGALWTVPVCLLAMCAPDLYTAWRVRAHRLQRVRCDWLSAAQRSLPRGPDVRR